MPGNTLGKSAQKIKKIVLASRNPVKAQATRDAFQRMFPDDKFDIESVDVPSGVSSQPITDEETLIGALNRARNAQSILPVADFWVGIEGGVENGEDGSVQAFAWMVVCSGDQVGKGRTGSFFLPPQVVQLIQQGKELGEADDIVFGRVNSKQDEGAVGILTDNVIDRKRLYEHALVLALIPFKNPQLFKKAD
jgi:inosine/xanthosine triphosphatase